MKKKEILILNTTHIGTTLCDFPLIKRVRLDYPADVANITVLLARRNGVLKKYIEKEFNCTVEVMQHNFTGKSRYVEILLQIRSRWKFFDLGICGLEPRKSDHILLWCLSKKTIAYIENNWHGRLITNGKRFVKDNNRHQSDLSCGVYSDEKVCSKDWPKLNLPVDSKCGEVPSIYISTHNNRSNSSINLDKLVDVLSFVFSKRQFCLVVNGPAEVDFPLTSLKEKIGCEVRYVVTKNFDAFLHLLNECDLVFVGDGGVSHVAAWLDKPSVVLFGETLPEQWMPMSNKVEFLFAPKAVNDIKNEEIATKIIKQLDSLSAG